MVSKNERQKIMALYEHVFIARQDLAQQQVEQLVENYKKILTDNGAKVDRVENWGLRTLAYRINKNRKAYYVLIDIDGSSEAVAEMERQMRINEDILRYLTIRVDEFEKGPSAVLTRHDKDDRGYRDNMDNRRPRRPREETSAMGEA